MAWMTMVSTLSGENLSLNLIERDRTEEIKSNFFFVSSGCNLGQELGPDASVDKSLPSTTYDHERDER